VIPTKFTQLKKIIGNTPLVCVEFEYKSALRKLYFKLESFNMTGSIKDRMALNILEEAYDKGVLKSGDTIVEATSGNTGIAFSALGKALGHEVKIFMPDWMSEERKQLMRQFGAEIRLVTKEEGGFLGSIDMAKNEAHESDSVFLPSQFDNTENCKAHYKSTGCEIDNQLKQLNLKPDAFIAGVGTGGTVMGVGKYLKEQYPEVKIYPLEPENSPTLSTGHKVGKHRIQGISDEFIPSILNLDELDEIVMVDDGDSIVMAQKICTELGLGVGISSGANFLGALKIQEKLGLDAVVVSIFCDSNKKYLSTDLSRDEPIKDGFISPDIKLIDFSIVR
jgi:cysteine synthase